MNFKIAVSCVSVNSDWEKVVTKPQLPVDQGTSVTFSCPKKHINVGSKSATCKDGLLRPVQLQDPPKCLQTGRSLQLSFYCNHCIEGKLTDFFTVTVLTISRGRKCAKL